MWNLSGLGLRLSCAAFLAFGVAACNSNKPAQPAEQQVGQVIAKVGGEDLTIHELQNEYRRVGISPDKVNEDVTRAVLTELVKRKALAQRAKAAGLDREPTVLLDILRGREQILATALLQRDIQAKIGGISKADTDRYINANPERFSRRTRFDVDQLTVNLASVKQEFMDSVKDASSLDAIEAKAVDAKIPYSRGAGVLFSGDIPNELTTRLRNRKDSDVFFVRVGGSGTFFKVRSDTPDPLSGDQAQQRAQSLLRNEISQEEMTRKNTDVETTYLGDYTKLMEKAAATPAPQSPASDQPASAAPSK